MRKINIDLDFEYLSKLPPEVYWRFVESYTKFSCQRLIIMEEEYLKKKRMTETKTYEQMRKMQNAINSRKESKKIRNNLMKLNFMPFGTKYLNINT